MELGSSIEVAEETIPSSSSHHSLIITKSSDQPKPSPKPIQQQLFTITDFINDRKAIIYYTGLENYDKFQFVLNSLGPASYCLNYMYGPIHQLSVPDQFFLVLMKLRRHKGNFERSRFFGISESDVYTTFVT